MLLRPRTTDSRRDVPLLALYLGCAVASISLLHCTAEAEPRATAAGSVQTLGSPTRERPLGVADRGIFADLDGLVQLALPPRLNKEHVHATHDAARELLVLYEGDWPIKVYPVGGGTALKLGARSLTLRPGDREELAPLLREQNVRDLAAGTAPAPGDADEDGIPDPLDVLIGAHKTALNRDRYDGRYERIGYPMGDVPREIGVCTDVVIRALRNAGIDLQAKVHEDVLRAPKSYPTITRPNTDIDHRRVKSLLPYFERHYQPHTTEPSTRDAYRPGDIVFMDTFPNKPGSEHVGIVSNEEAAPGVPMIINNWTDGSVTKPMNLLAFVPVTQRFRVPARTQNMHDTHGTHAARLVPDHVTQLVVVLNTSFSDWHARVLRFERRQGAAFRRVGPALSAVLGSAGYGWGDGMHGQGAPSGRAGPLKREGDLRSPAGMFRLGTVHGYGERPTLQLPYQASDEAQRCVDDASSAHYNRVVSIADVGETWRSAEHMRRSDDMYELALDLEHNKAPVVPGHGSCIFAHVWAAPNVPVTGCTALAKADLRSLLTWLKPGALWVALPDPEYRALRGTWGLP
jgi:uncharacterized protein YijF (DUF1287 family)